jgi:hypothetical protein
MERDIKIVRQLEQIYEPCRMMSKELKGGKKAAAPITMFLQR